MDELEKTAQETAAEEQTGDTMAPDAGEDFETLIRGRYKGEFDARVRKILDGRLRGLRQENERLRQEAVRTELLRQREQDEQLRRAMEFAVERARQQMTQAIASGGSRVAENGGRRRSVSRWDPKGLSGKELAEIRKRVQGGEKIRFWGSGGIFSALPASTRLDVYPIRHPLRNHKGGACKGADRVVRPYKGTQPPTTGRRGRRPLQGGRTDPHASVRRGTWAPPYRVRRSCGAGRREEVLYEERRRAR